MSELYQYFGRHWKEDFDFSDESKVELFNHESYGLPVSNKNGFLLGKKWLNVHIDMWLEDIEKGYLLKSELYEDPNFPHWWLDSIFKNK